MALLDGIPEAMVEPALILVAAHLAAEVPDEVGMDDRPDEALLILGLQRERLEAAAVERIGRDQVLVGVVDAHEFFVEAKLDEGLGRLAVGALREFLAGDAVGKAGDIDDAFIGVEELRLPAGVAAVPAAATGRRARAVFRFLPTTLSAVVDRCQNTMCGACVPVFGVVTAMP